jgi:hypothetical protein
MMVDDKASLRSSVPDVYGNYIWTLTPPGGRKAIAVYLGRAGGEEKKQTLRGRFTQYINDLHFGPIKVSGCVKKHKEKLRGQ